MVEQLKHRVLISKVEYFPRSLNLNTYKMPKRTQYIRVKGLIDLAKELNAVVMQQSINFSEDVLKKQQLFGFSECQFNLVYLEFETEEEAIKFKLKYG